MLLRADPMWFLRLQDDPKNPSQFGIYYRDGEPHAYVQFRLPRDEQAEQRGMRLDVADHAWMDADAYRGLWEFFAVHDLVGKVRWGGVPADDPAPMLLVEPRELRRKTGDALWMRVVDVEAGLPQRPYGEAGRLVLRVADELCEWNDATFELETSGKESECRRSGDEPDLTMPVRSLAMLASGHFSATALKRAGLLSAVEDKALTLADRMFATAFVPWCPDGF